MKNRGTGRIGLGLALALASCLRASAPEFPTHLSKTLELTERPAGPRGPAPFAVVAAGPGGVVQRQYDPGVTLVFNRPMRTLDGQQPAVAGVTLKTEQGQDVPGAFRWIGTHGLLFEPDGNLPGSTRFYARVPAGTVALDGSRLASDYVLEFTSELPVVIQSKPAMGSKHASPDAPIQVQLSQGVTAAELARNLTFTRRLTDSASSVPVPFTVRAEGEPAGAGGNRWLSIVPSARLPEGATFDLSIAAGLKGSEGPLPTDKPSSWSLQTYGPLRVDNVQCAQQSLGRCQAHRDFTLVTSNPVAPSEFRRHLKLKGPKRPARPNPNAAKPSPAPTVSHPLGLDPEFGDRFELTLGADLTDIFGQRLGSDVKVEFAIEAPYVLPAKAAPKPKSTDARKRFDSVRGASDEPPPDVPRRQRLFQDLEVGLQGQVLEALAGVGGAEGPAKHRIPVGSVNIPTYGVRTWNSPELATVHWLGQGGATYWTPPPAWTWFTPGGPANQRAVQLIDLDATLGASGRGAAVLQATLTGPAQPKTHLVSVTDLGISARISRFGSSVWVTHLATGAPAPGATVTVYDRAGKTLAARAADAQGLVDFSPAELQLLDKKGNVNSGLVLVARAGEDWAFDPIQSSRAISTGTWVDSAQKSVWAGLAFSERGVYRPGEVLRAGGYFRKTLDRGFEVPKGQEFEYTVRDVNGEAIAQGRSKLDNFGALSLSVELAKSAALGPAELSVRLGLGYDEQFSAQFQILEYKAAEFKVTVDALKAEAVHGTQADFRVHAEYLFGAPVAEGRVERYVSRVRVPFTPANSDDYIVTDDVYRRDLQSSYDSEDYSHQVLELDARGAIDDTIELDGDQPRGPQRLMFEAEVQDLTQQSQSGRASVLIHPAEFYLGLKQPAERFLAIGATVAPVLAALDPKGNAVSGVPVRVELFRRTWTTAVEDRPADSLYYQTNVKDVLAGACTVMTQGKANSCGLRLPEPGYYIARASAKDRLGNPVFASLGLYAIDDRADSAPDVGWREEDRRGLRLELDRPSYAPGDVAKVLVKSPFRAGTAMVTVERGSILHRQVVELKGPMPLVEIPIKDDFFPNAFVSVHLLRGRTARSVPLQSASDDADVGAPQFRVGYTELQIDPESRKLDVAISTHKKGYGPGDEVQAQVQLRDRDGKPSAGSVTFYVVDDGVLLLTGYKTPNPLPAFSRPRSLGVFPMESRDNLARIIALRAGERFDPLGWELQPRRDSDYYESDKGDEGGDGDGSSLRANFRTTVFFEAGHAVGNDGKAEFRFKLPDNLTAFRLMAVAAGSKDRFGFGEHTITSSRPLMARPLLPRALRVGDKFEAGVAVTSLGLPAGTARVTFKPTGALATSAANLTVNLPNSGQAEARFAVDVTKPGDIAFEFSATHGQAKDRVRVTRKATQPVRWLNAATYGVTKDSVAIGLGDLRGVRKDMGELNVTLSSSALVGLESVFENLIEYPYGCTEQLASRILPILSAPQLAAQQNVALPTGRIEWIDEAVGQIAGRQRYDGAFGYWDGDDSEVPWLTAYALFALDRASQQGYFVPRSIREQAVNKSTENLYELLSAAKTDRQNRTNAEDDDESTKPVSTQPLGIRQQSSQDAQRLRLAQAVFVADILASIGHVQKAQLYDLAAFHDEMSVSIRAQLVHAMARARLPRQDTGPLLEEMLSQTTVGPYEARVETVDEALSEMFESPARSTAWALRAVLAVDSAHAAAPKLARGLVAFRQHQAYRNTQEDAWALLALEEYRATRENKAPNFSAKVVLGEEVRDEFAFRGLPVHAEQTKISMLDLLAAPRPVLGLFAEGEGPMYYAVTLKAAKDGASTNALDEGLSIDKRMRSLEPADLNGAAGIIPKRTELLAGLGQLVMVDLLLESAEPRDQLVIDDPLPAGLEPVDFGFETTARALSSMSDAEAQLVDKPLPKSARWGQLENLRAVHREMRDDRVVLFLPAIDAGIYHLRYLARATTPGKFVMPPTRASCMYDPEIYGQNAGTVFEVSRERNPAPRAVAINSKP
jgi:alpha-2-macroglobulin